MIRINKIRIKLEFSNFHYYCSRWCMSLIHGDTLELANGPEIFFGNFSMTCKKSWRYIRLK